MNTPHIGSVLLLGLGLTILGCSGEELPDGMPALQPVQIKIVQGGTPVEGASVQLLPQDAANTFASGGSTDASGVAKIVTLGRYDGAPAGTYKVTIDKIVNDGPAVAEDDPDGVTPVASYRVIDPKFSMADSTTAEITVAEGGTTEETIDVGAAIKEKMPEL